MTTVSRLKELERRKQIQYKSEAIFTRLMMSFIQFSGDKNPDDPRLQEHIKKINGQWVKHCSKVKGMLPEGKDELMKHINKALEEMPKIVPLKRAEGTPDSE